MRAAAQGPDRRLVVFARLNLALFVAEFSMGVVLSSLGLVSDSLHQLVNCLGVGLSLLAHQANLKKTKIRGYSYGTERVEVLAAFANSVFLVLLSSYLVFEASHRIFGPVTHETTNHHNHSSHVLWVGAGGLVVNSWGLWLILPLLRKKDEVSAHRINIESLVVHALVDVASSCIVMSSSLLQRFIVAPWADPLSAVGIALLTLRAAAPIFQKTSRILAQAAPVGLAYESVLRDVSALSGVLEITNAHFWCLAPGHNVGSISLRIRADADRSFVVESSHKLFAGSVQSLTVECEREQAAQWIVADERQPPSSSSAAAAASSSSSLFSTIPAAARGSDVEEAAHNVLAANVL